MQHQLAPLQDNIVVFSVRVMFVGAELFLPQRGEEMTGQRKGKVEGDEIPGTVHLFPAFTSTKLRPQGKIAT